MNKFITLILFVLCSFSAQSQIRTVYFDANDKVTTDSTIAYSYGIYGKITGQDLWMFKKYDIDGVLMVTGAFMDDLLTLPQGKFVYYDWVDPNVDYANQTVIDQGKQRYMRVSGNFVNGLRDGQWISFYENGNVRDIAHYVANSLSGEYKSFDRKGEIIQSGQYLNDKKEGEWILEGGLRVATYQNDKVISVVKKTRRQLKAEQQLKP